MSNVLIDILPLKPGATMQEAVAYFQDLMPVFERHGLTRLDQPLEAQKVLRGSIAADLVNLFVTDDPEVSLTGMREDADYQAKIPQRDQIFDLERATILVSSRK